MKRYFYHKNDPLSSRDYWFWRFDTERGFIEVFFKSGYRGGEVPYANETVDSFVKSGVWIEIPAAEAVLML